MTFGLNIFRRESGIAITSAIIEAFSIVVYPRIAFIEIPRARATTKKNHSRITSFHLYFIRRKITAKASTNAKIIDRKFGVGSFCGVWSPNGNPPSVMIVSISPVCGLIIVVSCGV